MARLVTDLIDPKLLISYVRQFDQERLKPENQFSLGEYLPDANTEDLEFRIRQGKLQDVDIAEYRAFDTPAKAGSRQGVRWIEGSLGPISKQMPLGEEEILRQRAFELKNNDPLIAAILDDAELMTRAVRGRIELARGDLIDDGVVTIEENGLSLTADFKRLASMRKTAATVHSDPAANVITELLSWVEDYVDVYGEEPDHILLPKNLLGSWKLNEEVRDYAASNGTTPQRVNNSVLASIFENEGIPRVKTYDVKVRIDGTATRVLPAEKIYFMPSGEIGKTHFGTTAEAIKLRSKGMIKREDAAGLVCVILEEDHPVQTSTLATALSLPSLGRDDFILDAEVL